MEQHITILEDMADPAASLEKMDVLSQELDEFEEQSKVCTSFLKFLCFLTFGNYLFRVVCMFKKFSKLAIFYTNKIIKCVCVL